MRDHDDSGSIQASENDGCLRFFVACSRVILVVCLSLVIISIMMYTANRGTPAAGSDAVYGTFYILMFLVLFGAIPSTFLMLAIGIYEYRRRKSPRMISNIDYWILGINAVLVSLLYIFGSSTE